MKILERLSKNDHNNVTHDTKDIESYAIMLEENESNRTSDNILSKFKKNNNLKIFKNKSSLSSRTKRI